MAVTRGRCPHTRPVSIQASALRPSREPSAAAAVRMRHFMLWRRVVIMDSLTLFRIRTGRPALRAIAAVSGSILV